MNEQPVISRHRLPTPFRAVLAGMWLVPPVLLMLTTVVGVGVTPSLLDPRFLLPAALMALPALYIWQEGVDVLACGIVSRIFFPRFYAYDRLDIWQYDARDDCRTLTVWDANRHKVLECRAGHLTEFPALVRALRARSCQVSDDSFQFKKD